jgi:hypothetical protein
VGGVGGGIGVEVPPALGGLADVRGVDGPGGGRLFCREPAGVGWRRAGRELGGRGPEGEHVASRGWGEWLATMTAPSGDEGGHGGGAAVDCVPVSGGAPDMGAAGEMTRCAGGDGGGAGRGSSGRTGVSTQCVPDDGFFMVSPSDVLRARQAFRAQARFEFAKKPLVFEEPERPALPCPCESWGRSSWSKETMGASVCECWGGGSGVPAAGGRVHVYQGYR